MATTVCSPVHLRPCSATIASPSRNPSSSCSSSVCWREANWAGAKKAPISVSTSTSTSSSASRRPRRQQIGCTYSGVGSDFSSAPIDVIADIKTEKIVVLGGSGFVGTAIAEEATKQSIDVVSLSRSGRPSSSGPWLDRVTWISGDVFSTDWDAVLHGATAVVSCLGGFGSNEQMEKLNGDANVMAVNAASRAGIKKFVYISVHDYNLPEFALNIGYFTGKRRAEREILSKYPVFGTILRPGFIYGSRKVNGFEIPLGIIGKPLESFLARTETFTRPFSKLPASDVLFASPVSVKDVALAAITSTKDDALHGILNIAQIKEAAAARSTVSSY